MITKETVRRLISAELEDFAFSLNNDPNHESVGYVNRVMAIMYDLQKQCYEEGYDAAFHHENSNFEKYYNE